MVSTSQPASTTTETDISSKSTVEVSTRTSGYTKGKCHYAGEEVPNSHLSYFQLKSSNFPLLIP